MVWLYQDGPWQLLRGNAATERRRQQHDAANQTGFDRIDSPEDIDDEQSQLGEHGWGIEDDESDSEHGPAVHEGNTHSHDEETESNTENPP